MTDIDFELLQEPEGTPESFSALSFPNEQNASFGFAADRATETYFGLSAVLDNAGNLQVLIGVLEPYPANVWDTTVQNINPFEDFGINVEAILLEVSGPYFFFGNPSVSSAGAIYKWNGAQLVPFAAFPIAAATVSASPSGAFVAFSSEVAGALRITIYNFSPFTGEFSLLSQFSDAAGAPFSASLLNSPSGAIPQVNNSAQAAYASGVGLRVAASDGSILLTTLGPTASNPFVPVVPDNASAQGPPYAFSACIPAIMPRWDAEGNLTVGGYFAAEANTSGDGDPNFQYIQFFVQYFDSSLDLVNVDYFAAGCNQTVTVSNFLLAGPFSFGVTGLGAPAVAFELEVNYVSNTAADGTTEQTNCIQAATTVLQNLGHQLMMYLPGIQHFIIADLGAAGGSNKALNTRIYGPSIPVPPPLLIGCALGTAQVGVPYSSQTPASGGVPPYTFGLASCPE